MKDITLVVPTIPADVGSFLGNIGCFFDKLPINKILLICNTRDMNISYYHEKVKLFQESDLVSYDEIKNLLQSRTNDPNVAKRTGWYLQQFLKMAYARVCTDEYYLLWDSDTFPLKKIDLFNDKGKPYLDYKSEYNKSYFNTLSRILPGYSKSFTGSFISEHMLINSHFMCELLDLIEATNSIEGKTFYEKIINSIDLKDLPGSGFSEFETYGTFVYKKHPEEYQLRRWKSFRYGGFFLIPKDFDNQALFSWLGSYYHAVSIEKVHYLSCFRKLAISKFFIKFYRPKIWEFISFFIRLYRRLFNFFFLLNSLHKKCK